MNCVIRLVKHEIAVSGPKSEVSGSKLLLTCDLEPETCDCIFETLNPNSEVEIYPWDPLISQEKDHKTVTSEFGLN